ncbi:hypothetical protein A3C98_03525 [Candidatus Roizmanbacteria bacterium RIFCSPHIGHO2_02_FULL_37_15]|uniref:Uncharacterized protein n=1 Tax=Candidatus Roizmanbacteria bacterium RIFCSPLOWO2_01_FULL_37_16 TaxID=1802058 RepID=A0A1F7IIY4_9BACT|nr:MAG: hypothetical protein A2859_05200 [Candidatus Roizmanbacteria bacterium RIFCSPHIGHO2_01_FULL_37_16b]OGK20443.1 MAG: hypothetical protein A3C98_03525 [Candidatus Roizmanbacteria bacterium RIFCSPHIGHO2_02_FULL_37_15]OGK34044.1 MAG: hypothetical protein A3F57_02475 [Candidatus Roizmanbacteria bacterium RIFCSPHIGHO2_12_FULL_36_11]OGK43294.1 MAG: hypothetical protein A3B40_02270 [Candidatus Roizmanbacteria bacterium RIFCSPLOWO2_01_FULL_37_16]
MVEKVSNQLTPQQFAYLISDAGKKVLLCWTVQQDLNDTGSPIQPNSGACTMARYNFPIQPSTLSLEDIQIPEGELLAKACSTCPIMAQALAVIPTP